MAMFRAYRKFSEIFSKQGNTCSQRDRFGATLLEDKRDACITEVNNLDGYPADTEGEGCATS